MLPPKIPAGFKKPVPASPGAAPMPGGQGATPTPSAAPSTAPPSAVPTSLPASTPVPKTMGPPQGVMPSLGAPSPSAAPQGQNPPGVLPGRNVRAAPGLQALSTSQATPPKPVLPGQNMPPQAPLQDNRPEWQKMYDDMLSAQSTDSAKERGEIQHSSELAMHGAQRGADVLNARMGRSIGGGYASLQGQAMIGGMESERKALAEQGLRSDDQRRQILMDQLHTNLSEKNHAEDRADQMSIAGLNADGTPRTADQQAADDYYATALERNTDLTPEQRAKAQELLTKYQQTGDPSAEQEFTKLLNMDTLEQERQQRNATQFNKIQQGLTAAKKKKDS